MMPHPAPDNLNAPMLGIGLKLGSVLLFVTMGTLIKLSSEGVPIGQIMFFRAFFAIIPVFIYCAFIGELTQAFVTRNPLGHLSRSVVGCAAMGMGFYGLSQLPLPDVVALRHATPLFCVILAALFLHEQVGRYRWGAVVVGLIGVLIISGPQLSIFSATAQTGSSLGVVATLVSATLTAFVLILIRNLVKTEKPPTIVLYFSLMVSGLALLSWPFGWVALDVETGFLLMSTGIVGGVAQILMTQSYKFSDVSTIAPFDYTSIIFGIIFGYFVFGDLPGLSVIVGSIFVSAAGILIIFRERHLKVNTKEQRRHHNKQQ